MTSRENKAQIARNKAHVTKTEDIVFINKQISNNHK